LDASFYNVLAINLAVEEKVSFSPICEDESFSNREPVKLGGNFNGRCRGIALATK
jgi:hypothetical protein